MQIGRVYQYPSVFHIPLSWLLCSWVDDCPQFCIAGWVNDGICDMSCQGCEHFNVGDLFDGGDCEEGNQWHSENNLYIFIIIESFDLFAE